MKPFLHPPASAITFFGILHALSDPARLTMFRTIRARAGLSCTGVCSAQPPATLSFNFKVLRDAGLIRSERRGRTVVHESRDAEIDLRFPGLLTALMAAAEVDATAAAREGQAA